MVTGSFAYSVSFVIHDIAWRHFNQLHKQNKTKQANTNSQTDENVFIILNAKENHSTGNRKQFQVQGVYLCQVDYTTNLPQKTNFVTEYRI